MTFLKISLISIVYLALTSAPSTLADTHPLTDFGNNPGELTASLFTPKNNASALVVLLHGCGQNAEWLAKQTGLLGAAQSKSFALLLPQQVKDNNIQLCFNWFSPTDQLAGKGETASLMNMITAVLDKQKLNDVYLVGLSAGGALATSLLAQYPEQFSAATIIAGIGYPCANTLVKALSCMKSGSNYEIGDLANQVTSLHSRAVDWPNITIISGTDDAVVAVQNSKQMYQQWQNVMSARDPVELSGLNEGLQRTRMQNSSNQDFVELILIDSIGHGWPINSQSTYGEKAAPFVLESPFSTTDYLVDIWKL